MCCLCTDVLRLCRFSRIVPQFRVDYALMSFGFSASLPYCADCALTSRRCPSFLPLFSNGGSPTVRQFCANVLRFSRFSQMVVPRLCVHYALISSIFASFFHGAPMVGQLSADVIQFCSYSPMVPQLCVDYALMCFIFGNFLVP